MNCLNFRASAVIAQKKPCPLACQTMAVALVVYPVTRFLLEILRGDETGQFGTGLTISQCFSLLLLTVGIGFSIWPCPLLYFTG